jgi:hypothetical protein
MLLVVVNPQYISSKGKFLVGIRELL